MEPLDVSDSYFGLPSLNFTDDFSTEQRWKILMTWKKNLKLSNY